MKRIIALAAGTLSLTATVMIGLTSTATADDTRCPANRFCLFEHDDYLGGRAVFSGTDRDLRNNFFAGSNLTVHNQSSSMINNTNRRIALYDDVNCGGHDYVASAESKDSDFTNNDVDNRISCVAFL